MEILILLGVMATMDDQFYIKIYIVILSLRVKQNSFILFFELKVAKCFYEVSKCHGDRTRLLSSVTKMASSSEPLTVDNIRKIWKTEFLPNIKKEIRNELNTEIDKINCSITNLSKRLDSIEWSQQMISDKYDSVLNSMQSTKKQINDLNKWCEAQDNKINHLNGSVYDAEAAIDSI